MGVLEANGVGKAYGAVRALVNVSARFEPGEVHAVLGENGAGKSTLMNVLAGFTVPDSGTVTLEGNPLPHGKPFLCRQAGIAMVHQHFTLVPEFSVAENLGLARLDGLWGGFRPMDAARPALELAESLGWTIDPAVRTGSLAVGEQQRIEILKNLAGEAKVVIFDEPTAVLAPHEVEDLFRVMRVLRDQGRTLILIAHKLSEVLSIADRVTVLRRGQRVASARREETDADQLASWMVGEMPELVGGSASAVQGPGLTVEGLTVRGDRGEDAIRNVSFSIGRGEILGFGGVDGNGQVELAEALAGVRPFEGRIAFDGRPEGPSLGYIPQDRQSDGLALGLSILDNLLIQGHRRTELTSGPFLRKAEVREWTKELIRRFSIKVDTPAAAVGSLSGGNQQKVVVSRALDVVPDLLVAVNPTRGLDLRAAGFVHEQLRAARDAGAAIALISTDLDELAAVATRTVFLSRGSVVAGSDAKAMLGGSA